jgi:TetR/AcrR family transcriptional repressor of nem operon
VTAGRTAAEAHRDGIACEPLAGLAEPHHAPAGGPVSTPTTGRAARPNARDRLVVAAVQRLGAQGYDGSSVQDMAAAAGLTKGSLYAHFETKEALALAALRHYAAGNARDELSGAARPARLRLEDHFRALAQAYEADGFAHACLICTLAAPSGEDQSALRSALERALAEWSARLAEVLRDGQADGSVASDLPCEAFARFLLNSWQGAAMHARLARSRQPLDDFLVMAFPPWVTARARRWGGKAAPRPSVARDRPHVD